MKVSKCEQCAFYERRRWSHSYKPNGYHAIGMTHAYAYCKKHGKRCADVKKCDEKADRNGEEQ